MIIAQITDTHIKPPGQFAYRVVDTATCLRAAVRALDRLVPAPAAVVVTGDLVDRGFPRNTHTCGLCSSRPGCRSISFPAITTIATRCAPASRRTGISGVGVSPLHRRHRPSTDGGPRHARPR